MNIRIVEVFLTTPSKFSSTGLYTSFKVTVKSFTKILVLAVDDIVKIAFLEHPYYYYVMCSPSQLYYLLQYVCCVLTLLHCNIED